MACGLSLPCRGCATPRPTRGPLDIDAAVDLRHRGGVPAPAGAGGRRGRARPGGAAAGSRCGKRATNRFEIATVLPLDETLDAPQLLALAGGVAAVSRSPWESVFPTAGNAPATQGTFDGGRATAIVRGVRYTLGPTERPPAIGDAIERRALGGYLLVLSRESDGRELGFVTLQPRLSRGTAQLLETCRRHRVRLEMVPGLSPESAQAVARRTGVTVLAADDPAGAIRNWQAQGQLVAFVSDGVQAAAGFAQCDLAIGLAGGYGAYFPAQADLLAPDLIALADFIDTGFRRDRSVRDGVLLSMACNVVGFGLSLSGPLGLQVAFIPGYVGCPERHGGGLAPYARRKPAGIRPGLFERPAPGALGKAFDPQRPPCFPLEPREA